MRGQVECGGGTRERSFLNPHYSHSHPGLALCAQCILCGEPEEYVCLSGASNKGCVLSSVGGPWEDGVKHEAKDNARGVMSKDLATLSQAPGDVLQ